MSVTAVKWTFDQLLQTPLPNHPAADNFGSITQRDKDRCTHPITVQHWQGWEEDVKTRLKEADILVVNDPLLLAGTGRCMNDIYNLPAVSALSQAKVLPALNLWLLQDLRAQRTTYDIIGLHSYAYEVNEAVATSALYWNACLRLNQLFAKHGSSLSNFRFTMQCTNLYSTDSHVKPASCERLWGMALHLSAHALPLQSAGCFLIVAVQHNSVTDFTCIINQQDRPQALG